MSAIRITVTRTAGSTPREAGTQMLVWADRIAGTIGGGALEWDAMAVARQMLADGRRAHQATIPLGPALGQCCGGSVTLAWEVADDMVAPARRPLWIFGAGHVGRAIVHVMQPLPDFAITWVDISADRFPPDPLAAPLVAADPVTALRHAPDDAAHLVLTHCHKLDLALCHAILSRPFDSLGLIGSATKWARFRARLTALGHNPAQIARIACPIGEPGLGKHPAAIALGVASAMIRPATKARKEIRA
jgi:xanthine dehydrogenase accessory factor